MVGLLADSTLAKGDSLMNDCATHRMRFENTHASDSSVAILKRIVDRLRE